MSPGRSARKTVYLEPGVYLMSCWIKAPDGELYLFKGMMWRFVASRDSTGAAPPEPAVEVAVVGDSIIAPDTILAGTLTVAARLGPLPEDNTIHLVRLPEDMTRERLARWFDALRPEGRMAPAPAEFLGGHALFGSMPGDTVAYFTVEDLEPGHYVWGVSTLLGTGEDMIFEPVMVARD